MAYRIEMKEIAFLEDIFSDMDIQGPEKSGPGGIGEVMEPPCGVLLIVSDKDIFFLTRAAKAA